MADTVYDRLKSGVDWAQERLRDDEERLLATTPPRLEVRVTDLGFHNPATIFLYGVDEEGNEVTIMVGMEALALCLHTGKKEAPEPRRTIGFRASDI